MKKRLATVLGALALLGALVSPTGAAAARHGSKLSPLSPLLLSLSQMPVGWTATQAPGMGGKGGLLPPAETAASAGFAGSEGLPDLMEGLAAYGGSIKATFGRVVRRLDGGYQVPTGHGHSARLHQMSFPRIGNASAAYEASVPTSGITAGAYVLVARQGRRVVALMEVDIGTPSISQFERFARLAVAKVR